MAYILTMLFSMHLLEGDTQVAIRLWKEMQDKHLEPASTNDYIITGFCKEGHSLQGMEWLLNMSSWKLKPQEHTFEYLIAYHKKIYLMTFWLF